MKKEISIIGARENNLKNINVSIPWHKYTVITGLSGSGKSSLALDTIYTEGLRRYVECLSTFARQFLERVDRPDMDDIRGLPPTIAIESRNQVKTSRSTVGTTTEIYDYLRLLFAKIGKIYCPDCQIEVKHQTPQLIANELVKHHKDKKAIITFPVERDIGAEPDEILRKGFSRLLINETIKDIEGIQTMPKNSSVVVDRLIINSGITTRIADSIETGFNESDYVNIHILGEDTFVYSQNNECPQCQRLFKKPIPLLFSFNSPQGACPACRGFGNVLKIDPDLIIPNPDKSLSEGAVEPFTKPSLKYEMNKLLEFARKNGVNIKTPYKNLSSKAKTLLFEGADDFPGIYGHFRYLEEKNYKLHVRVFLSKYRTAFPCPNCGETKLRKEALWVKIDGKSISEFTSISVRELAMLFDKLRISQYEAELAKEIIRQIKSRIDFLVKVGLDYISLSRLTKTLSGGEAQRVNLACQLGSSLTETLYIMDEPSIGLHPRDICRLISIIRDLRDRNNTVIVVEHDFEMIGACDHIIELGPKAGAMGGKIVYQGSFQKFMKNSHNSLTKQYLTNTKSIPAKKGVRSKGRDKLTVTEASENNLKSITVSFPLGNFICITGVSGSGKSSLVIDVLYSALARRFHSTVEQMGKFKKIEGIHRISDIVMLDQNPIGKSSRSNPVTYIKAYDETRKVMSNTIDARIKGFKASDFSFNVPGGRCERCQGEGIQKIEMHFLADVNITCDECKGKRFQKELLEIKYRGKNIDEILGLTVDEAILFFAREIGIIRKLKILQDVGLGYLKLGQPAVTLSGGEAQRIKIARELGKKSGKDILYILDEPTVGLHTDDIKKLLGVLNKLVDSGNTVIVVEHNLDVIKYADYIIDLGPEGGDKGGYVVAQGTPEEIAEVQESYTGLYLKKVLH